MSGTPHASPHDPDLRPPRGQNSHAPLRGGLPILVPLDLSVLASLSQDPFVLGAVMPAFGRSARESTRRRARARPRKLEREKLYEGPGASHRLRRSWVLPAGRAAAVTPGPMPQSGVLERLRAMGYVN